MLDSNLFLQRWLVHGGAAKIAETPLPLTNRSNQTDILLAELSETFLKR